MQSLRIYEMPDCKMFHLERECLGRRNLIDLMNGSPCKNGTFQRISCSAEKTVLPGCICFEDGMSVPGPNLSCRL